MLRLHPYSGTRVWYSTLVILHSSGCRLSFKASSSCFSLRICALCNTAQQKGNARYAAEEKVEEKSEQGEQGKNEETVSTGTSEEENKRAATEVKVARDCLRW